MRVVLTLADGKELPCREEGPASAYVSVDGARCPACAGKVEVVDGHGVIRALAGTASIGLARSAAEAEFGPCSLRVDDFTRPLRVRCPKPSEQADRLEGVAECSRCRSPVGTLTVIFSTLFGLDEDRRMLHGRPRVY